MYTAALFTVARKQNQPSCTQMDEWMTMWFKHTTDCIRLQGKMKFTGKLKKHYNDVSNSFLERETLHILSLM